MHTAQTSSFHTKFTGEIIGRDPHLKWQGIPGMKIALSQKKPYCGWTHCFDIF